MEKTKITARGGLAILAMLLWLAPSVGEAQSAKEDYPKSGFFGGLRYMSIAGGQVGAYGWGMDYAANFHKNFGIAFELGGVYGSSGGASFTFHDILSREALTA